MRLLSKIILLFALLAMPFQAHAATCSANAKCVTAVYAFQNSDGTTPHAMYTVSGNGAKLSAVYCTTTQPSGGVNMQLYLQKSSTNYLLNSFGFAVLSGTNSNPVANLLTYSLYMSSGTTNPWNALPTDENGNSYIGFGSGDVIAMAPASTLTSPYVYTCSLQITQY